MLADGTVVLQYLFKYDPQREHRTHGVRAIVSSNGGRTWQADQYSVGHWGNGGYGGYLPGNIALEDGRLMSARVAMVGPGLRFQAAKWRPLNEK